MKKKYSLGVCGILFALGLFVTPGAMSAESSASASGPITVAVGVDPSFAPFFVADAEGMFKKHGLNVQVQQYANGGAAADALVARSADVAGVPDYNLLIRAPRADLKALGVYVEDEGNYVSVVAKKDISKPQDIKRIGIVPGTFSEYAADRFIKAYDLHSVKVVNAGPPEMVGLLAKDAIDAFILWEPWPAKAVTLGDKVLMPIRQFKLSYVQLATTRADWLAKHQEQAKAFMQALSEATSYINKNPAKAASVMKAAAHIPENLTEMAVKQLQFGVRDISKSDYKNFNSMLDFLTERKLIKKRAALDSLIVHGYVVDANGKQGE